jgi:hypothetical protein
MRVLTYVVCLFVSCLACSRQLNVPTPPTFDSRYSVNALRNDSTWFGKASASKGYVINNKPCTANQFGVGFQTDIPHDRGYYDRKAAITGCMEKCMPTQILSFSGIPLVIGKYTLASLAACKWSPSASVSSYYLQDGGDVTAVEFEGKEGWIQLTKYDSVREEVQGSFEVTLASAKGEIIHFTKGTFKAKLIDY